MKVYIDGQNFMYKVAETLVSAGLISDKNDICDIDIPRIISNIFPNESLDIYYFGAKVKVVKNYTEDIKSKSVKFSDVSRRLRNSLRKRNVEFIEAGQLRVRETDPCKKCNNSDFHFQEKGVDVGLAVQMVSDRLKNKEEKQVLLSSDTDLLPAVREIQGDGGKVIYVGFSNRTTKALVSECSETEIIRENEIIDAYSAS